MRRIFPAAGRAVTSFFLPFPSPFSINRETGNGSQTYMELTPAPTKKRRYGKCSPFPFLPPLFSLFFPPPCALRAGKITKGMTPESRQQLSLAPGENFVVVRLMGTEKVARYVLPSFFSPFPPPLPPSLLPL